MMFTASKSALASALALAGDIVERRNTIPILSNVLIGRIDAGNDCQLKARMTDLDVEAEIVFDAEVSADFNGFTVPAHLLREIVRKLPDGIDATVAPASDRKDGVTLKAGRSKFSLSVLPEADFPDLSAGILPFGFESSTKALSDALSSVAFAISTEETRHYLNGIYLETTDDGVLLVATDGHRLAKRFVSATGLRGENPGIIIPRKTVAVLQKILPKDGTVQIAASDAKIRFVCGGTRLTSKLIDGTFPDYRRVIPSRGSQTAEIEASVLRASVDRVSTVSTERGKAARFQFADGTLTLQVSNPDAGTAEEQLAFKGNADLSIGFNAKYVLDALSHLPDGDIVLSVEDPGSPAVLRADGDHTENLIVLMPMRV